MKLFVRFGGCLFSGFCVLFSHVDSDVVFKT